jgi:hypothetical protein
MIKELPPVSQIRKESLNGSHLVEKIYMLLSTIIIEISRFEQESESSLHIPVIISRVETNHLA